VLSITKSNQPKKTKPKKHKKEVEKSSNLLLGMRPNK